MSSPNVPETAVGCGDCSSIFSTKNGYACLSHGRQSIEESDIPERLSEMRKLYVVLEALYLGCKVRLRFLAPALM